MAVSKVLKITLFFPARDFVAVSEKIHQMGCVEVVSHLEDGVSASSKADTGLSRFLLKENTAVTRDDFINASRELDRIHFAIETIRKVVELLPEKDRQAIEISESRNAWVYKNVERAYKIAEDLLLKKGYDYSLVCREVEFFWKNYLDTERALASYIRESARIKSWIGIPVELRKISDGTLVKISAGQISLAKWEEFISTLKKETITDADGELSYVIKVSDDGKDVSFGLVYAVSVLDKVDSIIKRFGVSIISYPQSNYTPREMYERYLHLIDRMKNRSSRRLIGVAGFAGIDLFKLKLLYDYFLKIKTIASSERLMAGTDSFRFFNGWILASRMEELKRFLDEKGIPYYIVAREPSKGEDVPIVFENKKTVEPFEVVTDLYGKPNYYEPDPTPWLAPFFAAFFGICMADAFYGLIILVAGVVGLLKIKSASAKKFMKLVIYCGASTTLFGVLMGGYFGNIVDRFGVFKFFVPVKNHLMVFDPLKNSIMFLGGCLALGLIQTLLGSAIKFFTDIKNSAWRDVILQDFSTIGIQIIFPLIVMTGVFGVKVISMNLLLGLLGIFSIMLMINQWIVSDGIVLKLFQMFFSVYGAITSNALSDVLSYSRLFALGLSTSLLAMVLNEIAALGFSIPYIGFILGGAIIVFVHPFILAIGSLGAYVHTSRLQYLEFFNKFFQGGGREMKPLKIERRYVENM